MMEKKHKKLHKLLQQQKQWAILQKMKAQKSYQEIQSAMNRKSATLEKESKQCTINPKLSKWGSCFQANHQEAKEAFNRKKALAKKEHEESTETLLTIEQNKKALEKKADSARKREEKKRQKNLSYQLLENSLPKRP